MRPKHAYLGFAVLGTVLPLWQVIPFLRSRGLALDLFFEELFSTSVGSFFGMDVIVSSMVLWALVVIESRRSGIRHRWAPIAASLTVGVSLGLPLFLYMRERQLERARAPQAPRPG